MRQLGRDLRYAWRRLWRAPGFTIIAAITIALGVGTNAAVFSVFDPLLLRALPVTNPDQLVLLHSAGTLHTVDISERAAFDAYSTRHDVFAGVLADAGASEVKTSYDGRPGVARGEVVSANYFSMLGVRPMLGRVLTAEDDVPGRSNIVLGFDYWHVAFGADPSVVGRTLFVNDIARTIVGVAPAGFFGLTVGSAPDFYATFQSEFNTARWVHVVARLNAGVSPVQAVALLTPMFNQLAQASDLPEIERQQAMSRLLVTPASRGLSDLRESFARPGWVLMAMVALVLVVACANIANLVLTRSAGRRHEIATAIALGATRGNLVRQFVAESTLLAAIGSPGALLVGFWTRSTLMAALAIRRAPLTFSTGVDWRVVTFTAVVLGLTILTCGVLPALASTRDDLVQALKSRDSGLGHGPKGRRAGQILVVVQLAVSVTLLCGAGLLLRSFVNLRTFDVGFDRGRVLTVSLTDNMVTRPNGESAALLSQLLDRTRELPGVQAVSLSTLTPVSGDQVGINVVVEGEPPAATSPHAFFNIVTTGYFATLGIPILAGRDFSTDDDPVKRPVVIISRTMARHYFGDANPLGRRLRFIEGRRPPMEIVGVVADATYHDLREPATDVLYLVHPRERLGVVLLVRADRQAAEALARPVQDLIHSLDAGIGIRSVKTLQRYVDESVDGDRVIAVLGSTFSMVALLVAAVGLYGLLSMRVARQTKEIGLRIALGADARQILGLVAAQGAKLTAAGLLLGGAGAFLSTSVLTSLLFGLQRADPVTLAGVLLMLSVVAVLAVYVPARRAMRIDPAIALRRE